ncbi:MAG: YceI family protein [Thermodesulfobacteriota bacterium]
MKMKSLIALLILLGLMAAPQVSRGEEYIIDTKGSHAAIQFKIPHLGYSWLVGRFNTFEGTFSYDEKNPAVSKVKITIDTASIDSNHAKRDKHLRGKDFLEVTKYPKATFVSTSFKPMGKVTAILKGDFTLHGVTRPIEIEVTQVGSGKDPWGGFRRGFEGKTSFALSDYDINFDLGPASKVVDLYLTVEGKRQ